MVIVLSFLEGFSYQEIADITDRNAHKLFGLDKYD